MDFVFVQGNTRAVMSEQTTNSPSDFT